MNELKRFWYEEDGMGVIEIVLIILVLIGLVVIFKEQLVKLVNNLFNKVNTNTDSI